MRLPTRATLLAALLTAFAAHAEPPPTSGEIEVTATRIPEAVDRVPAYISITPGETLRLRYADDMRTALSGVAGVEAPPGGDAGPASAVPSFWGLHEFDAFLLVVDGVPLGGAFNPAIPDLDLANVDRVEVLKGSAPVLYGATSFVGVVQLLHLPAGQATNEVSIGGGENGSVRGSASFALPTVGGIAQSLSINGQRDGYSDPRANVRAGHALYRVTAPLAGGTLRFDAGVDLTRSTPPSPVPRVETALTTLTPLDANYNPLDARIDETRYHGVLGYKRDTPLGEWDTTFALAYSHIDDARGFLRTDLANADSQRQNRDIDDDYADTHLTDEFGKLSLTWGADLLYGRGRQASENGGYTPALDGSAPLPRTTDLHVDEINRVHDIRVFIGEYAQADWKPDGKWDVNLGLRLNETHEHKQSTHIDGFDPTLDTFDDRTRDVTRLSGMAGVSYRAWEHSANEIVLTANYRNTFKPAAVDFGPDNTPDILLPETAQSCEIGVKARALGGRLDAQAGLFQLDFKNLVIATTDASGLRIFENAGGEKLRGVEAEAHWHLTPVLGLSGAVSYHDAKFTHYVASEGGANIDVSGNQLTLSPHWLASLGALYAPAHGVFGSVNASYVGGRYLDLANTAPTHAYATMDAGVGYRFRRYSLAVHAYNLGDSRPPVTQSEFGDQSHYLLPSRRVLADLTVRF